MLSTPFLAGASLASTVARAGGLPGETQPALPASLSPSGKQAAAEKRAFQRAVTVHAAAAKASGFADGIEPGHDLAIAAEHARLQVGLKTAQRLAGHDVEFYRDQGAVRGIEDA